MVVSRDLPSYDLQTIKSVTNKDLETSAQRGEEQLECRAQSTCTHLWFLNTHNYNKQ